MSTPDLSVVVPAVNTLDDVLGVLAALEQQEGDVSLEVLLVNRLGSPVRAAVAARHPGVRILDVDEQHTIPQMRALAFHSATGHAVAVIEDHVIVPPGWGRELLASLDAGNDVVGGSVSNAATTTLLDWACFLCEYSHCIPPIPAGSVDWLTGNNVVYRREVLERYRGVYEQGKWENALHDAMRSDGVPLWCRPEIEVGHKKHYTLGEYFSQRYLYARSYAGARVRGVGAARRLAYGAAAWLLPPVLLYRTWRRIFPKAPYRGLLVRSIPFLAAFVTSWGLGEVVGYWFGEGDALRRVK